MSANLTKENYRATHIEVTEKGCCDLVKFETSKMLTSAYPPASAKGEVTVFHLLQPSGKLVVALVLSLEPALRTVNISIFAIDLLVARRNPSADADFGTWSDEAAIGKCQTLGRDNSFQDTANHRMHTLAL